MKMLLLALIPLFALIVYKRIKFIVADVNNNHSKLKADIFFFILILIIIVLISRIILIC